MSALACVRCNQRLTENLVEMALPAPINEEFPGPDRFLPPRMPQGTYAIAPELGGLVLHPDDLTGVEPHPDYRRRGGCCGLDGLHGPNLICAGCGAEIATQESDCWTQQQIIVLTAAVHPVPDPASPSAERQGEGAA